MAMPMFASGHLLHQALMIVWSVVASLTPLRVRGCLPACLHDCSAAHSHFPSLVAYSGKTRQP